MAVETFLPEPGSTRVRRRRDWRDGGRTVKPWDEGTLAGTLVALGVALLIAAAIRGFDPGATASTVASAIVLLGMLVAIALAFRRAKPKPLLRLRAVDVLYGVGFGVALRAVQGWLAVAAGNDGAFPNYSAAHARVGDMWLFLDVGSFLLFVPVIEELFFRGVLLVTVYSVIRRVAGRIPAILTALAVSTAASIATQAWVGGTAWEAWATPVVVGLACAVLVLATGRIWGAVFIHFVFNATYVVLATIGTRWG